MGPAQHPDRVDQARLALRAPPPGAPAIVLVPVSRAGPPAPPGHARPGLAAPRSIGSAASVSRLEREFLSPMRILSLAFPPDAGGEEMTEALGKFERSMFVLTRLVPTAPFPAPPQA